MSRNLRLLWAAQFVSLLGDGLYLAVIVNFALKVTGGSREAAGNVATAEYLPYLFLGVWAGVLVDRWDRRRVMMAADLLRALVLLGLYAADHAGWLLPPRPWAAAPVGLAVALLTTGSVFFNPARDALIPDLAEGEELTRANASVAVFQQLAFCLGPFLAAALLAARPLAESFLWDALTFLGSFACLAAIRTVPRPRSPSAAPDVAGALRYAWGRGDLRALLVVTALSNFFVMGPAMVGSAFLVKDVAARGLFLGLSSEAMYALYLSVFGVGMIAGTLVIGRLGGGIPRWKLLAWGLFLDGVTFFPFEPVAARGTFPILLVILAFHAAVVPLIVVVRPAAIQAHVPEERRGQVFALVNLMVFGTTALSAALTGRLAGMGIPAGRLFTWTAIGAGLCGLAAFTSRSLKRLV